MAPVCLLVENITPWHELYINGWLYDKREYFIHGNVAATMHHLTMFYGLIDVADNGKCTVMTMPLL